LTNLHHPAKILIVSDAWHPQINGVVRTLESTVLELRNMGHEIEIVGPDYSRWSTVTAPTYPGIKLEFFARTRLRQILKIYKPDFIHIATEGPLGWAARNLCLRLQQPFTTSYHTRFPEYFAARMPSWLAPSILTFIYAALRRFHAPSSAIMVATASIEKTLRQYKFRRVVRWSRGVDMNLFKPYGQDLDCYSHLMRPILLYVGRVAIEKNLRAFLGLKTQGTKVIVGDGPDLGLLKREYPDTHFLGSLEGKTLARHYAAADLFVFPSVTDTFGLVLIEACASGLRIASYPSSGPLDIFSHEKTRNFAVLDADLGRAIESALALPNFTHIPWCFAKGFSWAACTRQFLYNLQAPTPQAVKRITRFRAWLGRWYRNLPPRSLEGIPLRREAET